MHKLFSRADELSHIAIGAAIEVHRLKGPGLLESIYERCFMRELELRSVAAVNQRLVRIEYKGHAMDCIPLPHPSGASPWHRMEPGKTLLREAFARLAVHPAVRAGI